MQVNLIVLRTSNPEQLANFYQKMGIQFDYHRHGNGPFHYSTDLNGLIFEIYPLLKSQKEPDAYLRLGFEVENLDVLIEHLRISNVRILQDPTRTEWGVVAVIQDLDGRKIELKEPT